MWRNDGVIEYRISNIEEGILIRHHLRRPCARLQIQENHLANPKCKEEAS